MRQSHQVRFLLGLLLAVNAVSIFGYATFGTHPEWLARYPWSVPIFAVANQAFAQGQIIVSLLTLLVLLWGACRAAWVPAFLVVVLLSGLSEFLGTSYGIPFGKYEYTTLLGAKFMEKVPYLIPPSWFVMAIPSFGLAAWITRKKPSLGMRIAVGSLLLLMWDLTLDPAMSYLIPFWVWEKEGSFYGMPWSNLFGWYVTGVALMGAFEILRVRSWLERLPVRTMAIFYGANLMLPVGLVVVGGLWYSLLATLPVIALLAVALQGDLRAGTLSAKSPS
jgi:uncharacterized membrane protein